MKRLIAVLTGVGLFAILHSQPQLYLGVHGGGGAVYNAQRLNGIPVTEGTADAFYRNPGWESHFKGEALLGFGRLRFGYQFLYSHSRIKERNASFNPLLDNDRQTAYFTGTRINYLGHYGKVEIAVVRLPHFALVSGIALGGFTGNTKNNSGDKVEFNSISKYRFSMGADLNAEFSFGRMVILLGPNYYLFNQQDKINSKWKRYTHVIGGDLGVRLNLIKPRM